MNRPRITFWIPVIASLLFVASSVVTANAQSAAAGTTLTFSAPVRLPGITLAAGTYLFQDAGSSGTVRSILVFTADPRRLVATLRTTPVTRAGRGDDVVFRHAPAGGTPSIVAVYRGGGVAGAAFIYSAREKQEFAATPAVSAAKNLPAPAVIK